MVCLPQCERVQETTCMKRAAAGGIRRLLLQRRQRFNQAPVIAFTQRPWRLILKHKTAQATSACPEVATCPAVLVRKNFACMSVYIWKYIQDQCAKTVTTWIGVIFTFRHSRTSEMLLDLACPFARLFFFVFFCCHRHPTLTKVV